MRVVVWIAEDTWEACVDWARELLPGGRLRAVLAVTRGLG